MRVRRRDVKTQDIVVLYTIQRLSSVEISKLMGLSRPQVIRRLHGAGVDTSKAVAGWVNTICDYCGRTYKVHRGQWKRSERHYCSTDCYYTSLENPAYVQSRQGQRVSRVIVSQYFDLKPWHVVHHKDSNTRNFDRSNLEVYASQAEHMAHERGSKRVKPLWDGALVS